MDFDLAVGLFDESYPAIRSHPNNFYFILGIKYDYLDAIEYCDSTVENYGKWFNSLNLKPLLNDYIKYNYDNETIINNVIGGKLCPTTIGALNTMLDYIKTIPEEDDYGLYEIPNETTSEYWLTYNGGIIWTEIINDREDIFKRTISIDNNYTFRDVIFDEGITLKIFDIQHCWVNEYLCYEISTDGEETPLWINPNSIQLNDHSIKDVNFIEEYITIIIEGMEYIVKYDMYNECCTMESIPKSDTKSGYLYLIQPEEFRNTNIYKIGMTTRNINDRMREYVNPEIFVTASSNNIKSHERSLITSFEYKFGKPVVGREYFSGNLDEMLDLFNYIVNM